MDPNTMPKKKLDEPTPQSSGPWVRLCRLSSVNTTETTVAMTKSPPPPYLRASQMSVMLPTAPPKDEANRRNSGPPSTFYPAAPGINKTNSHRAKSLGRYTGRPLSMYVSNQQTAEDLPLQNPRRPSYSSANETVDKAHTGLIAAKKARFTEEIRQLDRARTPSMSARDAVVYGLSLKRRTTGGVQLGKQMEAIQQHKDGRVFDTRTRAMEKQ
jgi:hypothetical protein